MDGFQDQFALTAPGQEGLSKISIQTGTSHGGVVLPDGSIAQVSVDFDTLQQLSAVAKEYGGDVKTGKDRRCLRVGYVSGQEKR